MEHSELVFGRSSFLVSLPVVIGAPVLGALAAFFGQRSLAAILILLFLLAGASRLWAFASAGGAVCFCLPSGSRHVPWG